MKLKIEDEDMNMMKMWRYEDVRKGEEDMNIMKMILDNEDMYLCICVYDDMVI